MATIGRSSVFWISSSFPLRLSISFCKFAFSFSLFFLSSSFSFANSSIFAESSRWCSVSASFMFFSNACRLICIFCSRFWHWLFSLQNFSSILFFSLANSSISPAKSSSFCLETSSSFLWSSTIFLSPSSSPSYMFRMSSSLCWISICFSFIISLYRCSRSFRSNSKLFNKLNCSFLNSSSKLSFSLSNCFLRFSISFRCLFSNSLIGCWPFLITSIFCLCCLSISVNASPCSCFSLAISSMRATSTSSLVGGSGLVSKDSSRL